MSIDVPQRQTSLSAQVAEEIRVKMTRLRMSGRELARKLDVSPSWVSYRLTGTQPIDLDDLARIAQALDVGVVELIPRGNGQPTVTSRHTVDVHRSEGISSGRPAGRRDASRPATRSAPSGPSRPPLVPRDIAA